MNSTEKLLNFLREQRGFDAKEYIEGKTLLINEFFRNNGLDSAVIGISGGIDSAVTFGLLIEARKKENSPLKYLMPITMPIYGNGTSNQKESESKAFTVVNHFGYSRWLIDLTKAYNEILNTCAWYSDTSNAWANGQMASILRTPVLYYHAAILQTEGFKSIVVGTTNRDEGGYIGFFGKASDAMVDLQPIADLHKSEVYQIAKILNIPEEIINAKPAGDVFDNRSDEEMIDAPYWFIELYTLMKDYDYASVWGKMAELKPHRTQKEIDDFNMYTNSIENLHQQNAHKYQVGSPAHFIDYMPRKVQGGWK
jgi:NAD+ synthetase